ncbi:hypothetical protein MMC25_002084 [Agyrium rufum]|nr:hypothetical protein [Agyrium rufum]
MSSRALRKLQRERELQQQQTKQSDSGAFTEDESNEDGSTSEIHNGPVQPSKLNAFSMLDAAEDEEADIEKDTDEEDAEEEEGTREAGAPVNDGQAELVGKKKSRKKKKKKGKKKSDAPAVVKEEQAPDSQLDDIDLALRDIKVREGISDDTKQRPLQPDDATKEMFSLLASDARALNATNEMKKLFGNLILEGEEGDRPGPAPGRRRGRGPQQVDLGAALAGRNSPASRGQGLAGLALRRNVFMQGKEEWPKGTSGGLSMDSVEELWDFTTEYRYRHNKAYQDVQRQFAGCVESYDPQRMISLLQFNPYHISTLLQVSDIAKHQGDHSVSGDLLERALFTFGRAVHSSFPNTLSKGAARLDFRYPENREFWLAGWRYISNLGQRGTWRTAYEWAKLLYSLDPEGDPYCMFWIMDQLALRGGQFENFLQLISARHSYFNLKTQPNISISKGLAEFRMKQSQECRKSLTSAIGQFPWIFARLFQELGIDRLPKSIWGKQPRTDWEKLHTEAYVSRAKDLWDTPETITLLTEVAETVRDAGKLPIPDNEVSLEEARHIILSDTPSLISFVPRRYTSARTSASDPLPPEDNETSYNTNDQSFGSDDEDDLREQLFRLENRNVAQPNRFALQGFFQNLRSFLRRNPDRAEQFTATDPATAAELDLNLHDAAEDERQSRETNQDVFQSVLQSELLRRDIDRDTAAAMHAPVGTDSEPRGSRGTAADLDRLLRTTDPSSLSAEEQAIVHDINHARDQETFRRRLADFGLDFGQHLASATQDDGANQQQGRYQPGEDFMSDDDSLPDEIEYRRSNRGPHQATVESDEEVDSDGEEFHDMPLLEDVPREDGLPQAPGGPVLAPVGASSTTTSSNNAPASTLTQATAPAPSSGTSTNQLSQSPRPRHTTSNPHAILEESAAVDSTNTYHQSEDERNQRFLMGQGLQVLKQFAVQHGTDDVTYASSGVDTAPLDEYVVRLKKVPRQQMRDFIINYPLQQGAGTAVRDLVRSRLAR